MPIDCNIDLTLPPVDIKDIARHKQSALYLTIVFHPDTARIGQMATITESVDLGRQLPEFTPLAGSTETEPLADRHVSRCALKLRRTGEGVELTRPPSASRVHVAGKLFDGRQHLSREQLAQGLPILLGHSIVLWLCEEPAWALNLEHLGDVGRRFYGCSHYHFHLLHSIQSLASHSGDVLIRGATGTGKELVAQEIHRLSQSEQGAPWVAVNMAAIPAGVAAAALFGSTRGAFTGAVNGQLGYFKQAAGGTLFLDEIGDTPAEVQPQLLRALQQREIQVVGGDIEAIQLRVIAATELALDQGSGFRSALRYRLAEQEIVLKPLGEHRQDIGVMLWQFLSAAMSQAGKQQLLPTVDSSEQRKAQWAEVFHRALQYPWPGNVRQLENHARQIAAQSEDDHIYSPQLDRCELALAVESKEQSPRLLSKVDDSDFYRVYQHAGFEIAETARALGVSRQAVYRRIQGSGRWRLVADYSDQELAAALNQCDQDIVRAAQQLEVSSKSLRQRLRDKL